MPAVLADAQKDDAVDGLLHREVEFALAQAGVAQRQVARQQFAPALDLFQKGGVHLVVPRLALCDSAYWSKEPLRMASLPKMPAISSQRAA
jgi:hypothetical protein